MSVRVAVECRLGISVFREIWLGVEEWAAMSDEKHLNHDAVLGMVKDRCTQESCDCRQRNVFSRDDVHSCEIARVVVMEDQP